MARRNKNIPRPKPRVMYRRDILSSLRNIDQSESSWNRISLMERSFAEGVARMNSKLPTSSSSFDDFNTNPYVLLMYAKGNHYTQILELEKDLVAAKVFSSIETAAGRLIEKVTLSCYGWAIPMSGMHTPYSAIDGIEMDERVGKFTTLKSGPRCLNDEMSENFGESVLTHSQRWAADYGVTNIDFTYGVLYGTPKKSNKKDWHILRNICEKAPNYNATVLDGPEHRWYCRVDHNGLILRADVRIGIDWWRYLGGDSCALEVWIALIRACITPSHEPDPSVEYQVSDIGNIVSACRMPTT